MEGFFDSLLEKCAGKSATDRLHQRLIERKLNQIISSSNSPSSTGEPVANSAQLRLTPAQDQPTASAAIPEPAKASSFVRPYLPPRSKSYIPEPARRPRFRREDRSYITLDGLLPDEEYANWYPPESPPPNNDDSTQSSAPLSQNGSDSSLGASGVPLLYTVPKLPEMIGVGRFRRSKTATDEWFQQSLAKELRAMSPLVKDGFFLRGPPIHPFQNRKESDASITSSTYGQPVVSENGSIIVRGFVSASSSATTSGTLENRTQESSWSSGIENQGTTSSHIGHGCSCPDVNEDVRLRSNSIASSWESATETHQSPTATAPFLRSDGASPGVADSEVQQQQHKVDLVLGKNPLIARHLDDDLQVKQLLMAYHEEAVTEDERDGNSKDVEGE